MKDDEISSEQYQHWGMRRAALEMAVQITTTALAAHSELDDTALEMAEVFYEFLSTPVKD